MYFWRKTKTGTEVATTTPTSAIDSEPVKLTRVDGNVKANHVSEITSCELDQRIKELMRRDGSRMRDWSWELHGAIEEHRRRRRLREIDTEVRIAKGELDLTELEVDRLHEKIDEDCLKMVREGQLANIPKRRR